VSEVLLDGWIKYLSLAVVVYWLLDRGFAAFVFHHHLVDAAEQTEDGNGFGSGFANGRGGGGPASRSMAGSRYFAPKKAA